MEEQLEVDISQINGNQRPSGSWVCCLPCYWLRRNSGFHQMSLSVVTLIVTVLLVASPVLFLISSIPGEISSSSCGSRVGDCGGRGGASEKFCSTEKCTEVGKRLLSWMSWKENPCRDFFKFACGSWAENSERQEHLINLVTLQTHVDRNIQKLLASAATSGPFRKLGIFYKSCLTAYGNNATYHSMVSLLNELGGYVGPDEEPPGDLTDLVLDLLRLNGAPLFDVYLDSDLDDSSNPAPFIDLPSRPGRGLASLNKNSPVTSSSFGTGGEHKAFNFIKASIEEKRLLLMEEIMRTQFLPANFSTETKMKESQITLHFVTLLTKLLPREKEIIKSYQGESNSKMEVEELERKFPFVRWQYLLSKLFLQEISPGDKLFVTNLDYLEALQRLLFRFPPRVIHNGLLLIFASDTLNELVNGSFSGDRAAFCSWITAKAFGKAVGVLYSMQFDNERVEELRRKLVQLFQNLKTVFEERIRKITWADDSSKEAVLSKLNALRIQFSKWPEDRNVSSLLGNARVNPEDFFGNVVERYRQLRTASNLFREEDRADGKKWTHPFVANAFYVLTSNVIIVPLALLTQPHFVEGLPSYVPYSALGPVVAHEILHGFDLRGIGYDADGNARILMSSDSRAKFEARLDCFVKQFSSSILKKVHFLGADVDVQFDWNMTKNENVADIIGLELAYEAWMRSADSRTELRLPGLALDPRQLFFLNAAQAHCTILSPVDYIFLVEIDFHTPQPERVNGMMMNSADFGEAFKCPLGSPMHPRKKCSVW